MLTGDTVAVDVEKPAAGGRMIARVDGRVLLVAGAIPGERVRARVERIGKGVAYAHTVAVDEPSPDRRPAFADPLCGGCLYSHVSYARQLALKRDVIADAFARIARLPLSAPPPVSGSPEEGYRMRARLHARGSRLGFFREGTHDLCDVRQSRQLLPATCETLERLAAVISSLGIGDVRELELTENVPATERVVHLDTIEPIDVRSMAKLTEVEGLTPGPHVVDTLTIDNRPIRLRRHVQAFFQGNRFLLHDLVAHVVAQVPIGSAIIDLYAGAGLFAVAAATVLGATVSAIEGDPFAAADLAANAAAVGDQITTMRMPVERVRRPAAAVDAVIVDPPRTGMSPEAMAAVLALQAPRFIYVSCDVATLARDTRKLVDAGYQIDRVDAFDLFPNTPHVETVVVLTRA